jgi:glycosyltransferase involved in cell wall biosynthesis
VTSVKEGWGLIVTEAGSQATPAIVYDVDGLRDSVTNRETGIIVKLGKNINQMKEEIMNLYKNKDLLKKLSANTLENSKKYSLENTLKAFKNVIFEK